eukprot:SAG25_NODE_1471_length_2949_cov_4.091228_1_plen_78_part_00
MLLVLLLPPCGPRLSRRPPLHLRSSRWSPAEQVVRNQTTVLTIQIIKLSYVNGRSGDNEAPQYEMQHAKTTHTIINI